MLVHFDVDDLFVDLLEKRLRTPTACVENQFGLDEMGTNPSEPMLADIDGVIAVGVALADRLLRTLAFFAPFRELMPEDLASRFLDIESVILCERRMLAAILCPGELDRQSIRFWSLVAALQRLQLRVDLQTQAVLRLVDTREGQSRFCRQLQEAASSPPPSPPSHVIVESPPRPLCEDCWRVVLQVVFDNDFADCHRARRVSKVFLTVIGQVSARARALVSSFPHIRVRHGLNGKDSTRSAFSQALLKFVNVTALTLSSCHLTAPATAELEVLPNLLELDLSNNRLGTGHLPTHHRAFSLSRCSGLTAINLHNTNLGVAGLKCLKGLLNVRVLKVSNNLFGPRTFHSRVTLSGTTLCEELWMKLEVLDISANDIYVNYGDEEEAGFLGSCHRLRRLNVHGNFPLRVSDISMLSTTLQTLEALTFNVCAISHIYKQALRHVMCLYNLQEVSVYAPTYLLTASVAGNRLGEYGDCVMRNSHTGKLNHNVVMDSFDDPPWICFLTEVSARFRSHQGPRVATEAASSEDKSAPPMFPSPPPSPPGSSSAHAELPD